ncbi:MAG: hypothetical protein V3U54_13020 [Thermodesulfobacteriota bacterium]
MAYVDDDFPKQEKRIKAFLFPGILYHGEDPHTRRSEPNKNNYPLLPDQVTMLINLRDLEYFIKEAPQSNFDLVIYKQRYSEKGYNSLHRSLKKAMKRVQEEGAVEHVRVIEENGGRIKFRPFSEIKGTYDPIEKNYVEIYYPKAKKAIKKATKKITTN